MSRYKVIIVEDEEAIRNHIKKLIDWESMNFEIVGEADNGSKAIDLIEKFSPNLVMLDIRLPSQSGLEVLEKIEDSSIFFIVITAYKDFDYAYSCLKHNVSSYLLKPIDKSELYQAVNHVRESLDHITMSKVQNDVVQKQVILSKKIIISKFFEDIVYNKGMDEKEAKQKIKELNIVFQKYVAVAVIEPIEAVYDWVESSDSDLSFLHEAAIEEAQILNVIFPADRNSIIIILTSNHYPGEAALSDSFGEIIIKANKKLKQCNINVIAGISNWHNSWADIRKAWKEACIALSFKYFNETEKVLFFHNANKNQDNTFDDPHKMSLMEDKVREDLLKFIGNYEIEKAKQKFEEYFNLCVKLNSRREYNYKLIDLIINIEALVSSKSIAWDNANGYYDPNSLKISENIFSKVTIDDLKQYIYDVIDSILENLQKTHFYYAIPEIREVIQYIDENYGTEISLNDAAGLVYMSPTYFSSFFKQKTGMTFSNFLTIYRINKAKLLLKTNKYSADEVSQMVGYSSYRYFRNIFKKITGVTPNGFFKL